MTILISAGHSMTDPGAVNPRLNLREAELARKFRNAVALYLGEYGCPYVIDGSPETNAPLREAIKLAAGKTLAVEFHFNAANGKAKGIEVLANAKDKLTAQNIAAAIHKVTGSPLRGDKGYKPENAGQHSRLGFVRAGGLVVELEFIDHDDAMRVWLDKYWLVAKELAETLMFEVDFRAQGL